MDEAAKQSVPDFGAFPANSAPEKMPRRGLMPRVAGRALREVRSMLGLPSFLRNEDRHVLEQIIFPHFLQDLECRDILFVGCDWYTQGYNAWFEQKNYWTIEIDPAMRRFGAKQHIVGGLQNISDHFFPGSLDLIVCNGVFGWGLDAAMDVEKAIRGCHEALRDGGVLIVGVDGVEERRPYALETSEALRAFEPYVFAPLQTANYLTDTPYRHRFLFFRNRRQVSVNSGDRTGGVPLSASMGRSQQKKSRLSWMREQDWNFGSGAGQALQRVFRLFSAELKHVVGIDSYLANEDRHMLENVIFPYFVQEERYRNVLFVGCSWCTRAYNKRFASKNYWTIDHSPWKRRYGAKRHIAASLQDIGQYFPPGTLDLIICNGVYGWGLDRRADIEAAFTACREALREGGVIIIGWDDVERLNPCPLSTWECLRTLRPFIFPPLRTAEIVTATAHRHTYSFYCRPHAAKAADQG